MMESKTDPAFPASPNPTLFSAGNKDCVSAPHASILYSHRILAFATLRCSSACNSTQGSAPYTDVMAPLRANKGICVPEPGPTSRTAPNASESSGGMSAAEPVGGPASSRSAAKRVVVSFGGVETREGKIGSERTGEVKPEARECFRAYFAQGKGRIWL